jgi:hypothetical protein
MKVGSGLMGSTSEPGTVMMTTRSVESDVPGMTEQLLTYPPVHKNCVSVEGESDGGFVGMIARSCLVILTVVRVAFITTMLMDEPEMLLDAMRVE